jgi:hypothetical protein
LDVSLLLLLAIEFIKIHYHIVFSSRLFIFYHGVEFDLLAEKMIFRYKFLSKFDRQSFKIAILKVLYDKKTLSKNPFFCGFLWIIPFGFWSKLHLLNFEGEKTGLC